jgi:hypothetical protein
MIPSVPAFEYDEADNHDVDFDDAAVDDADAVRTPQQVDESPGNGQILSTASDKNDFISLVKEEDVGSGLDGAALGPTAHEPIVSAARHSERLLDGCDVTEIEMESGNDEEAVVDATAAISPTEASNESVSGSSFPYDLDRMDIMATTVRLGTSRDDGPMLSAGGGADVEASTTSVEIPVRRRA